MLINTQRYTFIGCKLHFEKSTAKVKKFFHKKRSLKNFIALKKIYYYIAHIFRCKYNIILKHECTISFFIEVQLHQHLRQFGLCDIYSPGFYLYQPFSLSSKL